MYIFPIVVYTAVSIISINLLFKGAQDYNKVSKIKG